MMEILQDIEALKWAALKFFIHHYTSANFFFFQHKYLKIAI